MVKDKTYTYILGKEIPRKCKECEFFEPDIRPKQGLGLCNNSGHLVHSHKPECASFEEKKMQE